MARWLSVGRPLQRTDFDRDQSISRSEAYRLIEKGDIARSIVERPTRHPTSNYESHCYETPASRCVARLLLIARNADRGRRGPALSEQTDPPHRPARPGRRRRHLRTAVRPEVERSLGPAGGDREPTRRGRHDCHRDGCARGPRWLYAGHGFPGTRHHAEPLQAVL